MVSTVGDSCSGDSGAPIFTSTPTSVILVGILTGSNRNHACTKVSSDGNFYTMFTLMSRYSSLAFSAAFDEMAGMQSQIDSLSVKSSDLNLSSRVLQDELASKVHDLDDANQKLKDSTQALSDLQAQNAKLQAEIPISLACVKGKLIKKVTGIGASCPSGYKVRK